MNSDLYVDGDEKFGALTSLMYSLFAPIGKSRYRIIVEDLNDLNGKKVLDIGCGPAIVEELIASKFLNVQVYGIDPSPQMIKYATKRIKKKHLDNRVKIALGSSREILFDEKFDLIISSFSYHHWKDGKDSIPAFRNYLKDGGTIAIYEFDNDNSRLKTSHGASEAQWNELHVEGFNKKIDHKKGFIILRLSRV
ncbi:MAG: class I SAM-dependent methyltransferase [Candidatus Thermoplasmatota archaeon]|nr:class I SAM-dependent methyltransferase [Candidatus Thermoplasmatota archaeon]MCL5681291.1 class I SAM-dependent methyltransferase [Candidatus Thermoplasmatota archaeon]